MSRGNWPLILGLALIAVAIIGMVTVALIGARRLVTRGPMMGPYMGRRTTFRSSGERIYYTATSDSGRPITFSGGPYWMRMHGGSCVSCHGPDGKGGSVVPMTNIEAPDIRYRTLASKEEEHPYTDATIKRAITRGIDAAGKPLNPAMPRWRMSEGDLNDLVGYLRMLGGGMPDG